MLIDRVKEALDGIKFKDKGSTTSCTCTDKEQSTHTNTTTTDSDKENDCCFIIQQSKAQLDAQLRALEIGTATINPTPEKTTLDTSRPKTRRCDCSEDEHDVEERYRTTPDARTTTVSILCPDSTSSDETEDTLQLLKAKLKAISEHATESTESESEKAPVPCIAVCNTLTIQTTTSATNTDPPCTMCTRESQWSPCGMPKGTQSFTPAAEKSLQTDQKKKAPLTTFTVENAVIPPKCCQVKNLVIQSLPPIEVKIAHRRMQSLLHFSIENNETNLLFKNDTCNVAFQLVKSQDSTDDPQPVEPERGTSLVKIMEKGKKTRLSLESATTGTPVVARKILELEYPNPSETSISEDQEDEEEEDEEEEDESKDTSRLDSSILPPPALVIPELNIALQKIAGTKRSISEVIEDKDKMEAYLFTNQIPEKTSIPITSSDSEIPPEREKVLRSYHVYDNVNAHDPGMLNTSSLDFVSKVDENVYRTYINPSGFQKPVACEKSNPTIPRTSSAKKFGLSKLSSLRINKGPSVSGENPEPSTIQEAVPKIWSLGFYANKSTQMDPPSTNQLGRSAQEEDQDEENLVAGEERAIKVINFTHSASRLQLTNEEEARPAQLQAERDEDPAYQPIGCDGRCNQWAADLRTVITSIRKRKEESEVEKEIRKESIKDIQKETRSAGCNCSLVTSKVGVQVSENTLEMPRPKQQSGRERQKSSRNSLPTSGEQANKESSMITRKTSKPKGNEEDNKGSPSDMMTEKYGSPKQSEKPADDSQVTLVEYRTMNGSQLETISLTVSYSTGDSVEVKSPDRSNTTKINSTREPQDPTSIILNSQKSELKTKFQLNNKITDEGKVKLRAIKDKLDQEHGEQSKTNIVTEAQHNEETVEPMSFTEEVSNFISGLTQHSSGELKKVIPIIRSRKSLSKPPQEKSKHNRMYDVNYVFGDFRQPKVTELLARKSSKQSKDALKVAGNGRYKDEAQLFTKFNDELDTRAKPKTPPTKQVVLEKPEPQIVRRIAKHSGHHKHKHKNNFKLETTSNSETITTERSKSEGELTSCQCAVSNGELHSCRYDQFHRMNPPMFNDTDELVTTIRKKRSYFNNCVTYYLKRTPVPGPPYSSNRHAQQQAINSSISSNTAS